jgi:hypothetical protein
MLGAGSFASQQALLFGFVLANQQQTRALLTNPFTNAFNSPLLGRHRAYDSESDDEWGENLDMLFKQKPRGPVPGPQSNESVSTTTGKLSA